MRLVALRSIAVAGSLLFAAPARAQDVRSCIDAHGRMQELFGASKLLAAREAAVTCARASCPSEVQTECNAFAKKVDAAIPRIVVRVSGARADARGFVEIDGEIALSRFEARPIRVDPGTHAVRVELEDGTAAQASVAVERGQTRTVDLQLPPAQRVEQQASAEVKSDAGAPSVFSPAVLAAGGIGIAGVLVGSYFGVRAIGLKNDADEHCPSDDQCYPEGIRLRDDAGQAAAISTVAFAVGIAGLGTAITLVVLAPTPSENTALLRVQGRF